MKPCISHGYFKVQLDLSHGHNDLLKVLIFLRVYFLEGLSSFAIQKEEAINNVILIYFCY